MAPPIVYTERAAGGERLTGLRLIGEQDEERWSAPEDTDAADAVEHAAAWLADRLSRPSLGIGLLCIDPRGAACGWVDAPGSSPALARA
ncbi:MAG: hypothetical protein AAGF47_05855, partial [Planctomycetota bacterium]